MKEINELVAKRINADSVGYMTIDGLVDSIALPRETLCLGCITGKYPIPLAQKIFDEMKKGLLDGKGCSG